MNVSEILAHVERGDTLPEEVSLLADEVKRLRASHAELLVVLNTVLEQEEIGRENRNAIYTAIVNAEKVT